VVVGVCEREREIDQSQAGATTAPAVTVPGLSLYSERTWLPITSALGFNVRTDDIVGLETFQTSRR